MTSVRVEHIACSRSVQWQEGYELANPGHIWALWRRKPFQVKAGQEAILAPLPRLGSYSVTWLWALTRDCIACPVAGKRGLEGYWDPTGQGRHVTVLLRLDLHRVRPVRPWHFLLQVTRSPVCRLLPGGLVFGLECNGAVVTWGGHSPVIVVGGDSRHLTFSTEIILPCSSVLCRWLMHFVASSDVDMVTNP